MLTDYSERRLKDFLTEHMLDADCYDWGRELDRFMAEMEAVHRGKDASVKMIPCRTGRLEPVTEPVSVTAIDIGGTSVRSAVVTMDSRGIVAIERLPAFMTPGVNEEITTAEFFRRIVSRLGRHLNTERICICFSLANVPLKDGDAVVVAGAKQICVTDLIGKKVGESFREAAESLGLVQRQRITVINDTVAAALGGWAENRNQAYSGFAGFVYGTGTNLAYPESDGEYINIESGAYCGFPCGDIDDCFDATLTDRGKDRFEKMVSGGYQGGLMTQIIRTAVKEGLLTGGLEARLFEEMTDNPLTAEDISSFSFCPTGKNRVALACGDEQEREILERIFDAVTDRSALLCSVTVTGALLRSGFGRGAEAPVFITAEGSTYLKQKGYREQLDLRMNEYAARRYRLHYEFHPVPDAVLKGTATAAISSYEGTP